MNTRTESKRLSQNFISGDYPSNQHLWSRTHTRRPTQHSSVHSSLKRADKETALLYLEQKWKERQTRTQKEGFHVSKAELWVHALAYPYEQNIAFQSVSYDEVARTQCTCFKWLGNWTTKICSKFWDTGQQAAQKNDPERRKWRQRALDHKPPRRRENPSTARLSGWAEEKWFGLGK